MHLDYLFLTQLYFTLSFFPGAYKMSLQSTFNKILFCTLHFIIQFSYNSNLYVFY